MMDYEERIEEFTRDGRNFMHIDLSNLHNNDDVREIFEAALRRMEKYPAKSLYTITDIENILFDTVTKEIAGNGMKRNEPYVKYGSVIGLDGIKKIMVNAVCKFSGRNNMQFFYTREQAVAWLMQQE